jgi:hypothetical protein
MREMLISKDQIAVGFCRELGISKNKYIIVVAMLTLC